MSEVTFTPEQIREIRRRIEVAEAAALRPSLKDILAAFPLPKVTRYRTFRYTGNLGAHDMRVRDGVVEFCSNLRGDWIPNRLVATGDAKVESWAARFAREGDWMALAALADLCQRPTEEVDP